MAQAAGSSSNPRQGDASEVLVSGEVNRMIQVEVGGIYERLEKLRQQSKFPSFDTVNIPMVLVLGNHSSGKSTFINYMLGQEVQKTGRAPTDCTFTVLVGGSREERLDGSALTRHAKYGFGDVQRRFGRDLVSQIELKVVENSPLLNEGGLMLVDSPGMIDPPGASTDRTDQDRGYDFKRVVQWFAERADVILVMFDPDKPGTTFETLDVLTTSLHGLSSKLLLILNKVDDFRTVHDFARAYGALCWNLSKVIPRKDLPFIYTMYVPQEQRENQSLTSPTSSSSSKKAKARASKSTTNGKAQQQTSNGSSEPNANDQDADTHEHAANKPEVQRMLEDEFDGIRGEVIREVERAPDRATDNILNLLKSTASRLKMHTTLLEACKAEYFDLEKFWKRVQIAGVVFGVGAASFYVIRTAGNAPVKVITAEELGTGGASSASTPVTSGPVATPTGSTTSPGVSTGGKHAWKENWAKQVASSQSRFNYSTLFKIILSACASNFAIWKASLANLQHKREDVLKWLPRTFERVYAQYLCKSDRIHDETTMQWKTVQPGLELALLSTKLDEFPAFEAKDKTFLDDVLGLHIPRLDRCVRDRTGDDHAYLRFKHLEKPSRSKPEAVIASEKS